MSISEIIFRHLILIIDFEMSMASIMLGFEDDGTGPHWEKTENNFYNLD